MKRKVILIITFCLVLILIAIILFVIKLNQNKKMFVSPFSKEDIIQSLAANLEKSKLPLESSPTILGDTITASISGVRVLFSKDKDLGSQIHALQLVLSGLKIDKEQITEIDLKFDKTIIRH